MKRAIFWVSMVFLLSLNSWVFGSALQSTADGSLARHPDSKSGGMNSVPEVLSLESKGTISRSIIEPGNRANAEEKFKDTAVLAREAWQPMTMREGAPKKLLSNGGGPIVKWDSSVVHNIHPPYGGGDQAIWNTTLDLYGATREYGNESFSDAYFAGVTAAIIPMFNRGTIITPAEALAVKNFVDSGGRVLLCGYYLKEFWNYFSENGTNLIAEQFGVSFAVTEGTWEESDDTTVRDPVHNYGQPHELKITNFENHLLTAGVTEWYLKGPSLVVTNPDVTILAHGSPDAYYNTSASDWINGSDIVHLAGFNNDKGGGILFSAGAYLLRNDYTAQHGIDHGYNGSKIVDNVARWLLGIHDPIDIQGDGEFSAQAAYENWPGDGSETTPYVIAGRRITAPMESLIEIQDTTAHFCVSGNYLNGLNQAGTGISLSGAINGIIENNIVYYLSWSGISLEDSSENNTVANNLVAYSRGGIRCGYSINNTIAENVLYNNTITGVFAYNSKNLTIFGNVAYINGHNGLRLLSSNNSVIFNNTGYGNGYAGISMGSSANNAIFNNTVYDNLGWAAIYIGSGNSIIIANNSVCNNNEDGIGIGYTGGSRNITISNNILTNNGEYGIWLGAASGGCLLWNNILSANDAGNAWDANGTNQWDDGAHGNWWDDYDGPDENDDGIGDTPYDIPGGAGAQDRYPLVLVIDSTSPTLTHPTNIIYQEGTSGHVITWEPSDAQPAAYRIYRDGTIIEAGSWNGSAISITIDGLAVGTYNFTLVVENEVGRFARDTVLVTVIEATFNSSEAATSTTSEITAGFTIGIFLIAWIVFILVLKRIRWKHRSRERGERRE